MEQKQRNLFIDSFTQILEESNSKKIAKEYSNILNDIQKEAIETFNIKGTFTRKD